MRYAWLVGICLLSIFPAGAAAPTPTVDALTGLAFVSLPRGCFKMGSPEKVWPKHDPHWRHLGLDTPVDADERPVHEACVDAFAIGQTEVTATAWQRVMGKAPPYGKGDEPAAGVSWRDAQAFIGQLNQMAGTTAYRLPSEAEWEYACRAGATEAPRSMGQLIEDAWYSTSLRRREGFSVVARLAPNAWGLHDMLGNVWEWTADAYRPDAYVQHALYNPVAPEGSGDRVIRGASFRSEYLQVRCASRGHYPADLSLEQIGLRLVKAR